jgi:hypothetical protein
MDKMLDQAMALDKIYRSLQESRNLFQLESTEHFMALYYQQFPFDCQYFQLEWKIDTLLREKSRKLMFVELDEELAGPEPYYVEKRSLKRLEEFAESLSMKEFEELWGRLHDQLSNVSVTEISYYPAFCEKLAGVSRSTLGVRAA